MGTCGCGPSGYGCEVGKQLAIDVFCGYSLIQSPLFPSRPLLERETIWQQYRQAVDAYLRHCGYLDEHEERMGSGGSEWA
jgi:hypothetical protein